jgi:phage terminase large subunit
MDGIHRVKAALQVAGDGRPRLTVAPTCVNTIAEFESYVWKEGRAGMRDEPEKVNDHAMDALRYVMNSAITQTVHTLENPFYA